MFCYTIGMPVFLSGAHYEGKIFYLQSEYRYYVYFFISFLRQTFDAIRVRAEHFKCEML
jgi:hypothetical protein